MCYRCGKVIVGIVGVGVGAGVGVTPTSSIF